VHQKRSGPCAHNTGERERDGGFDVEIAAAEVSDGGGECGGADDDHRHGHSLSRRDSNEVHQQRNGEHRAPRAECGERDTDQRG
jgi:hypothetical protein